MSGRIRTLKPEWLEDELLQESSSDARVLSLALILLADDHGNGRGSEKFLAGQVFPGQPIKVTRDAMARLTEIRFCQFYGVDGQRYFSIRNWAKHQRVDKPGKNKVPEPPANIRESSGGSSDPLASAGEEFAPRAIPSLSLPDPGPDPGTGPEGSARGEPGPAEDMTESDRETLCPFDLEAKAIERGVDRRLAEQCKAPARTARYGFREFTSYWTAGKGMGQKRPHWMAKMREDVRKKLLANQLSPPSEFEADDADRDRRQRDAQAAHEARVAELNAKARERFPDGVPPIDVDKLVEGIG